MAAADQETHASSVRPRSYQDESYQHGFLGAVGDLQKEGELQDVVLEVEGRRFPCHRLVLSAAIPYFRVMFTSDMAESRQNTVVLQGLDADMFAEILSYIYSGTLHVSLDRVQHLYQAADLLQLDYVRDTCSSYMAMNVERSTCVDMYKFADVFSMNVVLNSCLQYICQHFVEVSSSEEFCSLSVDQLTEIISQDKLDVKEETRVWEAVVRWVQHSREDRLQHLPSILSHIRFNLLTSDDTAAILEHPLVREDPGSSEVIRNVVHSNRKPRHGMTTEMVLLCDDENSKKMLWMNPGEGKYIRCDYDLAVYPYRGVVTCDNEIYVLAADSHIHLCKYNHAEDKWEQKSTVSEGPRELRVGIPNDYLMEIEGHDLFYLMVYPFDRVVVFKKYNQHTNEWHNCSTPQPSDSQFAFIFALSCNQRIYLFERTEMHWYDPVEDRWTRKALSDYGPEVELDAGSAVAMGTEIFWMNPEYCDKMLVYDTEADSWSEHPNPGLEEHDSPNIVDGAFFVLQNTLHAMLDYANDDYLDIDMPRQQVFVYDRHEGVWSVSCGLPFDRECVYNDMNAVARMYLPYLMNTSHADTRDAENPEGPSE
ncbi:PREDICTED: kelch repeat and BTB domain-containing protein 12-like [Branchiostoma belcheri]|uniref:Kelch repeat and BTB domain-containing protein 12-like n=1 Tax=Branchiostoma belcheri TaxID=7741 RepID=A0A6P4ZE46_BRABE|nr:PREDICTED: kelch repeat and BTB domain-containing protein 12-like [Branchiostoma belcheri]